MHCTTHLVVSSRFMTLLQTGSLKAPEYILRKQPQKTLSTSTYESKINLQ